MMRVAGCFQSMFEDHETHAHLLSRFELEILRRDCQFQNSPPANGTIGTDLLPGLSLALLEEGPETEALIKDVEEMQRMLEAYLAFARGDAGEAAQQTDIGALLEELKADVRSPHIALLQSLIFST